MAKVFTIGFSGKKEGDFLGLLSAHEVKRVVDIRLWRASRFVPWASGANLAAALGERYVYMPELAPTKELLCDYKDGAVGWVEYEKIFNGLLAERKTEKLFSADAVDGVCFLCSEKTSEKCHRRLVAEYLARHFPGIEITHL
ncbi:MAG: DUF488 domain-containing protein [Rickettsiales bacterium]|jgi:uncharacterized protein (DUF488 family)|nr:DUF488 domain-containing protein [Rickettsiales bacterium]